MCFLDFCPSYAAPAVVCDPQWGNRGNATWSGSRVFTKPFGVSQISNSQYKKAKGSCCQSYTGYAVWMLVRQA